jgi:hypothetical protein
MKNDETATVYEKYIKNKLRTKTAPLPCVTPNPVGKIVEKAKK